MNSIGDAVNIFFSGMIVIITQFILHPKQNENAAGHANGETSDIDGGKGLVPDDVSESDPEIVS